MHSNNPRWVHFWHTKSCTQAVLAYRIYSWSVKFSAMGYQDPFGLETSPRAQLVILSILKAGFDTRGSRIVRYMAENFQESLVVFQCAQNRSSPPSRGKRPPSWTEHGANSWWYTTHTYWTLRMLIMIIYHLPRHRLKVNEVIIDRSEWQMLNFWILFAIALCQCLLPWPSP